MRQSFYIIFMISTLFSKTAANQITPEEHGLFLTNLHDRGCGILSGNHFHFLDDNDDCPSTMSALENQFTMFLSDLRSESEESNLH